MAHLIPESEFNDLVALAQALINHARGIGVARTFVPRGTSGDDMVLAQEAQAFSLSVMALAKATPLNEDAMMIAIGAATGTLLAQAQMPHALLLKLSRDQMKATYDEVVETARPKGNA